jgi:hypothetical protein
MLIVAERVPLASGSTAICTVLLPVPLRLTGIHAQSAPPLVQLQVEGAKTSTRIVPPAFEMPALEALRPVVQRPAGGCVIDTS